jgi:hypothetical protein
MDTMVADRRMFGRFGVTSAVRPMLELFRPVRPKMLMTDPPLRNCLDATANPSATIRSNRSLQRAFIVINKQPRRRKAFRMLLLDFIELNGRGDRVSRTTIESALMVDSRAIFSEINP